jgi:CRP/FNR family transcriptional regulator
VLNQEFLRQNVLFKDLTESELLEIILIGHVKTYEANKVIFKEGDPGDTMYIIVSGCVRISKIQNGNEEALAVLDPKAVFGEMTMFDRKPRSAHAIAHEKCSVFAISMDDLVELFKKNRELAFKFLWAFCLTLTDRLRATNERFQVMMSLANSGF